MMNLDLLFNVAKATGNNSYKDIAVKHAMTTMNNHFRPDYTCWHVVSYNNDGTVEKKQTFQARTTTLHGHADKHGPYTAILPAIVRRKTLLS